MSAARRPIPGTAAGMELEAPTAVSLPGGGTLNLHVHVGEAAAPARAWPGGLSAGDLALVRDTCEAIIAENVADLEMRLAQAEAALEQRAAELAVVERRIAEQRAHLHALERGLDPRPVLGELAEDSRDAAA